MVAHLLRLKLTLLRNGLRRSPWQVVGLVVAGLYGLGALLAVGAGLVALAVSDSVEVQRAVLVTGGSLLVAGWAVLPLAVFGVDATVDPARFVTYPVPRRALLAGLGLSALIGVPGVVTAVGVVAASAVWWRDPAAVLAAVLAGVVVVALCVAVSRAATTALAPLLSRRRGREIAGFAILALLAATYLTFGRLTSAGISVGDELLVSLGRTADLLGWTPLGAAWAVPADVVARDWGTALARFAILLGSVAAAGWAWDAALARSLVRPPGGGSAGSAARGLGWFARVPASPTGAITARCLVYWARDPRYVMAIAAVPLMPLAMWAFGAGQAVVYLLPFLGVVMGWSLATDTSADGTALWLHVATPTRGLADRLGRVAAAVVVLGPLVVGLTVALAALTGQLSALAALLGATLGAFLTALGVSSVMSALVVMRVQQAGENPFGVKQGASLAAVGGQLVGMSAVGALALPEVVLGGLALAWQSAVLGWVALLVGLVLGGLLLVIGARWGGHLLDQRGPLLLARLVGMR